MCSRPENPEDTDAGHPTAMSNEPSEPDRPSELPILVPRAALTSVTRAALWTLRVLAVGLTAMVIYTFICQL